MPQIPRRSLFLAAVLVITAVLWSGRAKAADSKGNPDLSGRWALNEPLSDDPMEKMHEKASGGHGGGSRGEGGGGLGGFGMGGHGGGGSRGSHGGGGGSSRGGSGKGGGSGEDSGTPNELLWDLRHIVVTDGLEKDPQFVVDMGADGKRVLFTDGRKVEEETGAGTTKIKAKRKSGKVVVDTEYPNGREVTETWELLSGSKNLVVTTKISGKRGTFSFKRVYDPEPAAEAVAPASPAPAAPPPTSR